VGVGLVEWGRPAVGVAGRSDCPFRATVDGRMRTRRRRSARVSGESDEEVTGGAVWAGRRPGECRACEAATTPV
jgi:hypothetical protein